MTPSATPSPRRPGGVPGLVPRVWHALLGERDPVDAQLRELARQGAIMARLAHVAAFALLILFSLGSLVALSADALAQVLNDWQRRGQVDIPAAISVAVSTLLVTCMDVAALYAASMLRMLAARGAPGVERRIHQAVLVVACVLESATYLYMGALYDQPASIAAWALIVARAAAAPLFAVYLSLARPLPVGPRDILHGVEMASGAGVLRDTVTIAADPFAPLSQKAAIFNASAVMTSADRARLAGLLAVVAPADHMPQPGEMIAPADGSTAAPIAQIAPPGVPDAPPPSHPTGPGSPSIVAAPTRPPARQRPAPVLRLEAPAEWRQGQREAARGQAGGGTHTRRVRTAGKSAATHRATTATVEAQARAVWVAGMTVTQLQRAAGISRNAAGKWRKVLLAEGDHGERVQALAQ